MRKSLYPLYEKTLISQGYDLVVGIDEVGRGSWAGPVAVGSYLYSIEDTPVSEVNDSKQLKLEKREEIYSLIPKESYLVLYGELYDINTIGIGKTVEKLVYDVINKVNLRFPEHKIQFVIDGQFAANFGENTIKRIKADEDYYSVAMASIMAKVERDRFMKSLSAEYEIYGFKTNVGYPSKSHRDALKLHGPCNLHRQSFKPIGSVMGLGL